MEALKHLNNVIANGSAFVPASLAFDIVSAAKHLGIAIHGGIYNPETGEQALYVANY